MMIKLIYSLLYRKFQLGLTRIHVVSHILFILICLLFSAVPFQINDGETASLSISQVFQLLAFYFIVAGLVAGYIEIKTNENRLFYLLVGNRQRLSLAVVISEGLSWIMIATMNLIVVDIFYLFHHQTIDLLSHISIIISTLVYGFIAYSLTLFFKNTLFPLAILLIFPLILAPFFDRMLPLVNSLLFYEVIERSVNSISEISNQLYLGLWLLIAVIFSYYQTFRSIE